MTFLSDLTLVKVLSSTHNCQQTLFNLRLDQNCVYSTTHFVCRSLVPSCRHGLPERAREPVRMLLIRIRIRPARQASHTAAPTRWPRVRDQSKGRNENTGERSPPPDRRRSSPSRKADVEQTARLRGSVPWLTSARDADELCSEAAR